MLRELLSVRPIPFLQFRLLAMHGDDGMITNDQRCRTRWVNIPAPDPLVVLLVWVKN